MFSIIKQFKQIPDIIASYNFLFSTFNIIINDNSGAPESMKYKKKKGKSIEQNNSYFIYQILVKYTVYVYIYLAYYVY